MGVDIPSVAYPLHMQGQQKAVERVAQRKYMQEAETDSFSTERTSGEALRGHQYSRDMLDEQRRLAMKRVAEKRREEDRAETEALRAEEEERKETKRRMAAKAEALRIATAQRVAAYKVCRCDVVWCPHWLNAFVLSAGCQEGEAPQGEGRRDFGIGTEEGARSGVSE